MSLKGNPDYVRVSAGSKVLSLYEEVGLDSTYKMGNSTFQTLKILCCTVDHTIYQTMQKGNQFLQCFVGFLLQCLWLDMQFLQKWMDG